MRRTIFGMNRVVNSMRAGIDIPPMIGPTMRPTNRSMAVQSPPPTTWKNTSAQRLLLAIATIRPITTAATIGIPLRGTIWKSRTAGGGPAWVSGVSGDGRGVLCHGGYP